MSDVLFVHNNFPAQFRFIAEALQAKGDQCVAIASSTGRGLPGIPVYRWKTAMGSTKGIFPFAVRAEADLIRAHAAAEHAVLLKKRNFNPDLIIGHPGWGETVLLKVIFPEAKQILHGEFYYRISGGDVGFDPEFGLPSLEQKFRAHAKNATMTLAYSEADRIVTPTPFQASVLPEVFRARTTIIHEGIDTDAVKPIAGARFALEDGRVLDRSVPVITFINRRFEPLRGYHIFIRALPKVLAAVPEAHVILIGADEPGGYGKEAPKGTTWKKHFLGEVERKLDMSRVHFTGRVTYDRMLAAFSISTAHVYYTYPFVLSWSLLEAMACECLIVGSDTAPVRDAIEHQVNGLLLDFFDVDALSETLINVCRDQQAFAPLRKAARETVVNRFDRTRICQPAWLRLIDEVRSK
jgi:glycosyltransferase involved in cell wall biosynthesis